MNEEELGRLREKLVSEELPSQHDLEQICDRLYQYAQEFKVEDVLIELRLHMKMQLQQLEPLKLRDLTAKLVKNLDKVKSKMRLQQKDVRSKIDELHRRCRVDAFEVQEGKFATATTEEVELLKESLDNNWQCTRIDPPGRFLLVFPPEAIVLHDFDFFLEDLMMVQEGSDNGIPSPDFWYYPGSKGVALVWDRGTIPLDKRHTVYVFCRLQDRAIDGLKEEESKK